MEQDSDSDFMIDDRPVSPTSPVFLVESDSDTEPEDEHEKPQHLNVATPNKAKILNQIEEDFVMQHMTQLKNLANLMVEDEEGPFVKSATKLPKMHLSLANRSSGARSSKTTRDIIFPKRTGSRYGPSSGALASLFQVIGTVHKNLTSETTMTLREVYYQSPGLFKEQRAVYTLVDDLAATLSVRRGDLGAKGLFCGENIQFRMRKGNILVGNRHESSLIPCMDDVLDVDISENIRFILVVEKEAVFHSLAQSDFMTSGSLGQGILVTGKGFPDVATRQMLHILETKYQNIPMFIFVDADPHGIQIMLTYMKGSESRAHENSFLSVEHAYHIGLHISELKDGTEGLIPLTLNDRKKIKSLMARPKLPFTAGQELKHMLAAGYKAEIEILATTTELKDHLTEKIRMILDQRTTA